jgi:hypothetical protein
VDYAIVGYGSTRGVVDCAGVCEDASKIVGDRTGRVVGQMPELVIVPLFAKISLLAMVPTTGVALASHAKKKEESKIMAKI